MPSFGAQSKYLLSTCDLRLQELFNEVVKEYDCKILCGYRGREEQEKALASGASKAAYGQSKHNYMPSCAVDVMPYHDTPPHIRWDDLDGVRKFAETVKRKANEMGIEIRWGGEFKNKDGSYFFDGPHWELVDTSHARVP